MDRARRPERLFVADAAAAQPSCLFLVEEQHLPFRAQFAESPIVDLGSNGGRVRAGGEEPELVGTNRGDRMDTGAFGMLMEFEVVAASGFGDDRCAPDWLVMPGA